MKKKSTPAPRRAGTKIDEFIRLATELVRRDPKRYRSFLRELRIAAESSDVANRSHIPNKNR